MLKFRFVLEDKENGFKQNFKTLRDISKTLNIPYHQCRSILLSDDKIYIHKNIEELTKKYKISKNTPLN